MDRASSIRLYHGQEPGDARGVPFLIVVTLEDSVKFCFYNLSLLTVLLQNSFLLVLTFLLPLQKLSL